MKKILIVGMLTSLAACGQGTGSVSSQSLLPSSTFAAQGSGTAIAPQGLVTASDLLISAYQDGQAEIQLGRLALQRSTDNNVTTYAQRMIDDHTLLNSEISRLARLRNVTLPSTITADQQATMTRLQGLSGTEFDKAYMDENITVHDRDVTQLRLQIKQATENDIQQFAAVAYPTVKQHLIAAEEINGLLNPAAFLMSAYRDGLHEIQMSQLALQKATRDDVKAFAQRMIADHTALNSQISQVAQRKGVTLPTTVSQSQQAELTDLANCMGIDFDKAYMDVNVVAHAKAVLAAQLQTGQGNVGLGTTGLGGIIGQGITGQGNAGQNTGGPGTGVPGTGGQGTGGQGTGGQDNIGRGIGGEDTAGLGIGGQGNARQGGTARGTDPDVVALAQSALPILTQHYQMAVDLDNAIQPSLLYSAAQNNQANLQLAGLALLRAPGGTTSGFAQRMVGDINNIRSQLTSLAQQRNVSLPVDVAPNQIAIFSNLAALPSANFEQSYLSTSIAGLRQQIDALGSQGGQSNDAGIQAFGAGLRETLLSELAAAQSIVLPGGGS